MSTVPFREEYQRLSVYRKDEPELPYDLSDNTNLFGSSPAALRSVAAWANRRPGRYPSAGLEGIRAAIGRWVGVGADAIVPGCGSNGIIDATFRAFARPGATVAMAVPTFVMAPHFAASNGMRPRLVPSAPDETPDVDGLLAGDPPIVYLATPNNPTGKASPAEAVRRLLDRAPGVVILDEAYTEFLGSSWAEEGVRRGNVIVTRTFSKAWGLAGLRVGYGVAAPALALEIEKARGPYAVNAVAEQAAIAAVTEDGPWLDGIVAAVRTARIAVTSQLRALGSEVLPSDANFFAVPVRDAEAAAVWLETRGVGVRAVPASPVRGPVLRITVGPEPMMTALVAAMGELPR